MDNRLVTPTLRRLGYWSATLGVILALIFLAALVAVLASGEMPPAEPYQTIISVVSLLSAPLIVCLWALLHQAVAVEKRAFTQASLALVTIFAALTSINRYVALTVVRQSLAMGLTTGLDWFMPYGWPSIMAAIEVLAWGFFLGLACLSLAPAFSSGKLERALRCTLTASGIFCLLGALGQAVNIVWIFFAGILGWGLGLTAILALLAVWFHLSERLR